LQPEERAQYFLKFLQEEEDGYDGDFGQYIADEVKDDILYAPVMDSTVEEPVSREDTEEWVPATINAAEAYGETTTMLKNKDFYIMSPEAILSALEACGVDNARIEIEGGSEIPVCDGSSLTWALEIQKAGLRDAPVAPGTATSSDRRAPAPKEIVSVMGEGGSFISFYPGEDSAVSAGVDFLKDAEVLGRQWITWKTSDSSPHDDHSEHYRWKIAPARKVFKSFAAVEELFADGLIQAGPDGCCLVAEGDSWYDPSLVRFPSDEAARHTAQAIMGIMSLCASPGGRGLPVGHIVAFEPTPELQIEFAKAFSLQSKDYSEEPVSN
jgi:UDP-3-O-[3-hydroxymyristoyl] N-acetylglucosamine deacetylase